MNPVQQAASGFSEAVRMFADVRGGGHALNKKNLIQVFIGHRLTCIVGGHSCIWYPQPLDQAWLLPLSPYRCIAHIWSFPRLWEGRVRWHAWQGPGVCQMVAM